jgi:toluene monooxygenase system protein A
MRPRSQWLDLARKLDWELSYVDPRQAFPEELAGPGADADWSDWEEPFRTTYAEYVAMQRDKEAEVAAVRDALGGVDDAARLPRPWLDGVKMHTAALPLAEFAAVIGNLRAARFGRASAWRTTATFGALDELRHTQIPLGLMHELVKLDAQFDWTHRFYHSNNWVAIAARHLFDEMLVGASALEFAIATNFVFETGFTNLQFIGLSALAHGVGDRLFERMLTSIQSDEARHAQIGPAVLKKLVAHDRARAQELCDKWFWRSWQLFAVLTGFSMDYFAPLEARSRSFKEFVEEWVVEQYLRLLEELGLERPWYWDTFRSSLDRYHHMVYAAAYSYRASVWFDFVVPGPRERAWLLHKYPESFGEIEPIWEQITARWEEADPGNDLAVHATAIPTFCDLCQLVLCGGTPSKNSAIVTVHDGVKRVFCSEPCRWIFEREPERYAGHRELVKRVLAGEAPANLIGMLQRYFGLTYDTWGKDAHGGEYPFVRRDK